MDHIAFYKYKSSYNVVLWYKYYQELLNEMFGPVLSMTYTTYNVK